jgi:hypothetical protein
MSESKNYYTNFFGRMTDGRFMTNYSPNCKMNDMIMSSSGNNLTSWEYKEFLIKNTDNLLSATDKVNSMIYGCNDCSPVLESTLSKYVQNCNKNNCLIEVKNENGLGLD